MAPLKRPRLVEDDEEDSGDDRSSVGTPGSRKRARPSTEARITSATGSETPADLSNTDTSDGDEDDDEAEIDEEEEATIRATQIILQSAKRIVANSPAEHGIIESVRCINFMNLHVVLGPSVNFVIGMNGSGKSAVLTALTLCLGGKPSSTNRGSSLKDFIKEGEESSTVIVKLKNQGYGFQQDHYGDSIIVERTFSRAGSSGFKLKSANGRIISTKRGDLEEICDFFTLQIDNPLNVLTQDMARQFLNESTPAEKYKFFLKGVQLEQLDHDYKLLQEIIHCTWDTLEENRSNVVRLERLAREAKEKLERHNSNNEMRAKLKIYGHQYIWSQVTDEEERLKTIEASLAEVETNLEKAQHNVDKQSEKAVLHTNEAAQVENAVSLMQQEQTAIDEKKIARRLEVDAADRDLRAVISQQKEIASQLKTINTQIQQANAEIAAEDRRMAEADGGSRARKLEEIDRAKKALDELTTDSREYQAQLPDLKTKVEAAREKVNRSDELKRTKDQEISAVENRIMQLNRDQGNARKNPFVERLMSLVRRNEHKFQEKPLGPIGQFVTLLKPKWSSILEKTFGGTLNGYVVTSKRDQSILQGILFSNGFEKIPIFIGNNRPLDLTGKEPAPEFDTALRVLQFDSELIRRQLIIQHSLDQTILIESRQEANSVMHNNGGRPPTNVRACLTMHDMRPGCGFRIMLKNGASSMSPIQPWNEGTRMKTDAQAQLRLQQELLERLRQERNTLDSGHRNVQRDQQICERAVTEHGTKSRRYQSDITKTRSQIEDMEREADQAVPDTNRRQGWEDSRTKAEEEKAVAEGSYQDAVNAKDKASAVKRSKEADLQEVETELKDLVMKINKQNARLDKARTLISQSQKQKTSLLIEQERLNEHKQDVQHQYELQKDKVVDWVADATKHCPRIHRDPGDTSASLQRKVDKISADLEKLNRELGGSIDELTRATDVAYNKFREADNAFNNVDEMQRMLRQTLNTRKERWSKFRKLISARARAKFSILLRERSFRGQLITDHQNHILELKVEPDKTRAKAKGRQTQTLSGGEKSFSTICLLLALWDAMGSPIRCLDEFDVFMDNVNRDVTLRMIMQVSQRTISKQYVLISPQAMGNITLSDNCKVILLSKVDPNQRRLTNVDDTMVVER